MVIFQYNLYIFGIRTVLYPKPCYNESCYKEAEVYHCQWHQLPHQSPLYSLIYTQPRHTEYELGYKWSEIFINPNRIQT